MSGTSATRRCHEIGRPMPALPGQRTFVFRFGRTRRDAPGQRYRHTCRVPAGRRDRSGGLCRLDAGPVGPARPESGSGVEERAEAAHPRCRSPRGTAHLCGVTVCTSMTSLRRPHVFPKDLRGRHSIDWDIVWRAATNRCPVLRDQVAAFLPAESGSGEDQSVG
jgi:hypothetical protein